MARRNVAHIIRICPTCSIPFSNPPWKSAQKYCSHPCYAKSVVKAETLGDRFLARLVKTDYCWIWGNNKSYGRLELSPYSRISEMTHRLSWIFHNGPIPDGLWVLHHCDNPPCVNPDHLFLGTCLDNNADRLQKGRYASQGRGKLTPDDVREIRRLLQTGMLQKHIAVDFNVASTTISRIYLGKTWKHID